MVCFLTEKDFIARSKHKGFIRLDDSEALNVLKEQHPCYNNSLEVLKKGARYILGAETRCVHCVPVRSVSLVLVL